jgi:putative peptide zinc metalloprotease protein
MIIEEKTQDRTNPNTPLNKQEGSTLVINESHTEYHFTETFYGQLIANLDEVFEEVFLAPLEEVSEEKARGTPQLTFDEQSLRMLFSEIAAIYVNPLREAVKKIEKGEVVKADIQATQLSLSDISRAGAMLGLGEICESIDKFIGKLEQIVSTSTSKISSVQQNEILLGYTNLAEILPQVFSIEGFKHTNIPLIPAPSKIYGANMTLSLAALNSDLSVYHYPPRIHKNIDIIEIQESGQTIFWFKDKESNRYFKAKEREYEIISLIDGNHSLAEICDIIKKRMKLSIDLAKLAGIIAKLDSIGLIDGIKKSKRQENKNDDFKESKKFKLANPDKFLSKLNNYISWVFTKEFVFISLSIIIFSMIEISQYYNEFFSQTKELSHNRYIFFIVGWLVISLHEIGHGVTCKHYGGQVTDMGILFFYYFIPAGYCNISDIYLFKNKLHRVYVLLAGLYTQFLIASLAAIGWLLVAPHTIISDMFCILFWAGTASTVINLVPLLKLDGYYILTNLLSEYNLQAQSQFYTKQVIEYLFLGNPTKGNEYTARQKFIYIFYGSILLPFAFGIRIYICASTVYYLFTDRYLEIQFLFFIFLTVKISKSLMSDIFKILSSFYKPVRAALKTEARPAVRARAAVMLSLLVTLFAVLFFGNYPERIKAECILSDRDTNITPVFVQAGGTIKEVKVLDQEYVTKGQLIAVIENYNTDLELSRLRSEIDETGQHLEIVQSKIRERLIEISRSEYKWQRDQQVAAELVAETADLNKEQHPVYPPNIDAYRLNVEKLRIVTETQQNVLKKLEELLASKLISPLRVDKARFEYMASIARKREAEGVLAKEIKAHRIETNRAIAEHINSHYQNIYDEEGLAKLEIELAMQTQALKEKQKEYELVLKQEKDLKIVAVQDGKIDRLTLMEDPTKNIANQAGYTDRSDLEVKTISLEQNLGRVIKPGTEICRIVKTSQRKTVVVEIPEGEIGLVRLGQPARIRLRAMLDILFESKIESIGVEPVIKPDQSRIYRVYVSIVDPADMVRPGMSGVASIEIGRLPIISIIKHWLLKKGDYGIWLPSNQS